MDVFNLNAIGVCHNPFLAHGHTDSSKRIIKAECVFLNFPLTSTVKVKKNSVVVNLI